MNNADEIVRATAAAKSLRWLANMFAGEALEDGTNKLIRCIHLYCTAGAESIDALDAKLARVTAERDAAVADLEGTGACFTCKHFRRNGGECFGAGKCRLDGIEIWPCNEPGVYRAVVPDDGRKTYEWRGVQQAGEGEADESD